MPRRRSVKAKQNTHQYRREQKQRLIEYMGGKCVDCGYSGHPAAFDLDHVIGIKQRIIAHLLEGSWYQLLEEASKCNLVCANCHRIRTYARQLVT